MAGSVATKARGERLSGLAGSWRIDPEHTTMGFSVRHMMITTVRGRFDDFEGTFSLAGTGLSGARASITTRSINTGNSERDGHLRSNDFLGADHYPTISFVATGAEITGPERARVSGDLTIKGVTRPVELDVSFEGFVPRDWKGRPRLSLRAATSINRRDFGVNWNQVLETGGVLVADKVDIELDIAALREDG